jgi:DNA-directed RNA polymerase beta subunit
MMASRIITQLVESDLPVKALVEVGSPVSSDTVIALDGENHVVSNKLHMPGIVEEVVTSSGKRFGVETNRIWFKMRSFYNLENGDKLSNRHGGKGVVTVIPDELMPWDPDTGEKIEVCIAPESVTNRRSMSVLWEMMLTRKAWDESFRGTRSLSPIHVDLFEVNDGEAQWSQDENHNFAELARKYSFKRNLIYRNQTLPNATFASKLFWMRLDKIAMEIVSSVGKKRTRNNFGAVVDSAKVSGQRCNAAKLLAMSGRGLVNLSLEAIENNMSGQKFFKDLLDSVKNKRYLK